MRINNFSAIALTSIIILIAVLIVCPSTASAVYIDRTWTPAGGTLIYDGSFNNEKARYENFSLVYNWKSGDETGGEKITFFNLTKNAFASVSIEGPYTKDGDQYSGYDLEEVKVPAGEEWNAEGKKADGYYKIMDDENPDNGGWLQVVKQTFDLELDNKKVQEGTRFSLTMKSNGRIEGVMKLTIEDSDGYSIMNADKKDIYEIPVNYVNKNDFVATGQEPRGIIPDRTLAFNLSELSMEKGKYTIILKDNATDAEAKTEITVEKRYLDVECDDAVVKGEDIVVIITSSFYKEQATITVDDMPEGTSTYNVTLDEEGKKKVKISTTNLDYGTHKITVEVSDLTETRYVTIQKEKSSLNVPDNATIGEIVHLKGTSDFGEFALIVIDNVLKAEARISDDKFEWDWDTSGEIEGYREIEVFIVNTHEFSIGEYISEDWQSEHGVDASAGIILQLPTFSMRALERIAKGDEVLISGTATGTDHIYLIVFNSRGKVVFPAGGTAEATPVNDGVWEEEITGLDTESYVVISLHKGRDDETEAIKNGKWVVGDESKTVDLKVAIVEDAITRAGSDDIFSKDEFRVVNPEVKLELEDAIFGEELTIVATTNVKDGTRAWLSVENEGTGGKEIKEIKVENGEIRAEFDTTTLSLGSWNISVTIPDRCSDEGVITIKANTSTPAPTPTPVAAVEPSPTSTPPSVSVAEETKGTRTPGFELLSLLAALIAIACRGKKRRYRTE